jgi:hypothetical protein
MGPQMNANERKCKTHQFVCAVHMVARIFASGSSDTCAEEKIISVHLRSFADFK